MKKVRILLAFALCIAAVNIFAQSREENTVRNILAQQSAAWNGGDIKGFMKGYWESDSLMFIGKKGLTYGWENTLNNYRKSYPDVKAMGQLTFDIIKIMPLSGEYLEVIGKWHLKREAGDLEGHFNLLFRKIKGSWVIVMDHSS